MKQLKKQSTPGHITNAEPAQVLPKSLLVFPKLVLGNSNDTYEKEADQMADQVISGSSTLVKSTPVIGTSIAGVPVSPALQTQIESKLGKGSALDRPTESFMSARFGANFSNISIHNDNTAGEMANILQAKAFTVGKDVFFNPSKYQPNSKEGKQLLAHELTHTLQQNSAPQTIQKDDDESPTGVDIDFDMLPPHLQLTLPHFLLDADTSRIRTQFSWDDVRTSLEYSYGEGIDLGFRYQAFSTQLGFTPSSSILSYGASLTLPSFSLSGTGSYSLPDSAATIGLSGSYRGFRLGGSYNFGTSSLAANFGYGAPLLPTPDEMGSTFGTAGAAVPPLVSSIPDLMPSPLSWYAAQQERIEAVTKGVSMFNRLREEPATGIRFGVGGRLSYNPTTGLFVFLGVRGSF